MKLDLPASAIQSIMIRQWPETPSFGRNIAIVRNFTNDHYFSSLIKIAENSTPSQRVHIPIHKRGAAISYHELHQLAPEVTAFYHSRELLEWCSSVVGERLRMTPVDDLSSCSILIYDTPGDHIRCHYDLNFYRGRHFTILLSLVNTNAAGNDVSSARLFVRHGSSDTIVPTPPNTLVLFEGALARHGITPLKARERRIVLSMTYCADPARSRSQDMRRRFKDVAYFGLRALWT